MRAEFLHVLFAISICEKTEIPRAPAFTLRWRVFLQQWEVFYSQQSSHNKPRIQGENQQRIHRETSATCITLTIMVQAARMIHRQGVYTNPCLKEIVSYDAIRTYIGLFGIHPYSIVNGYTDVQELQAYSNVTYALSLSLSFSSARPLY